MTPKNPGARRSKKVQPGEDVLNGSSGARVKEVPDNIPEPVLGDKDIRLMRDEITFLRAELQNRDNELQSQKDELCAQTEELQVQLEELRSTGEELEKANTELKVQVQERRKADRMIEYLASFPEFNANPVLEIDGGGEIIYANPATYRIFGDMLSPDRIHPMLEGIGPGMFEHSPGTPVVRDVHVGTAYYQQTIIYLPESRSYRIYVIDITGRMRSERLLKKRADLIDLSPDGIIVRKQDGTIRFWSKGAEALYGWTRDEARGRQTHTLLNTRFPESLEAINRRLLKTGNWAGELAHTTKDGREIFVQSRWRAQYDESGGLKEIMESNVDITDSKRAEGALRENESRLASDIAALTRLQAVSTRFVQEGDLDTLLVDIMDSAIAIAGTDKGTLQLLRPGTDSLEIAAQRGFQKPYLDFFSSVSHNSAAACGTALKQCDRVVVEDVTQSPIFMDTPALGVQLAAGVRAVQSTPLIDRRGQVIGILTTHWSEVHRPDENVLRYIDLLARQAADIIERKLAEEALRESEERFRALADNIPNLAWMANADGWIFWYNKQWYDYTGTTPEEMQGWGWQKVHHPDHVKPVTEDWRSKLKTGQPYDSTFPLRGKDGKYRWFLTRVTPIRDEQGNIQRWFGTNTDITDRKRAEEAMRETSSYLESLFNYANAPIIVWNPDFRITRFNHAFERLTGYTSEEIVGKALDILFPPDSRENSLIRIKRTLAGEFMESAEVPILRRDGATRIVLWNSANILGEDGKTLLATIAQGQDITERKRSETVQQTTLYRFYSILSSMYTSILLVSEDDHIEYANQAFCNFFELEESPEDLIGLSAAETIRKIEKIYMHPKEAIARITEIVGRGQPVRGEEVAMRGGRTCLRDYVPITIDGKHHGRLWLHVDITEHKRADEAMRETSSYLESLINYANAPIIVWDTDFRITRFNHAFERMTGYAAEDVLGKKLDILFPPESKGGSLAKIKRTLTGEYWESVEIPILQKDGATRIALWNSANILGEKGNTIVATIAQGQDITERKRAEKELIEAKMHAELYLDLMGHDISNMHQIIMGRLEIAKEVMDADSKLEAGDRELIDTSLETLERSARLIENVRNLQRLRRGEFNEEIIDLDELIAGVIHEYDGLQGDGSIKFAGVGHHLVKANKLLHDVFTNLIGNALKHANGAKVAIDVRLDDLKDNGINYYRVSIADNGPGIPDGMKGAIFNRLQRGDTMARGMGLGLYLVKSLVESYGGRVWVEDRVPGDHTKGSRFVVYLLANA